MGVGVEVVGLEGDHRAPQSHIERSAAAGAKQDPMAVELEGDRQHAGKGPGGDGHPSQGRLCKQVQALLPIEHLEAVAVDLHVQVAMMAVTIPNMPASDSTWGRMWQCHTQAPGSSTWMSTE